MLGLGLGIDSIVLLGGAAGSPYAEIGNIGYTADAGNVANPSADLKYVSPITIPVGGVWVKRFFASFTTGTTGVKFRPVIYTGTGSASDPLFKQGQEFTCPSTFAVLTELGPINWNSDGSAMFMAAGNYTMGIIFGGSMGLRGGRQHDRESHAHI